MDRTKQATTGATGSFPLRLPEHLDRRLRDYAQRNNISINAAGVLAISQLSDSAVGRALGAYLTAKERPLPEPFEPFELGPQPTPLEQAGWMIVEYGKREAHERASVILTQEMDDATFTHWQAVEEALRYA